MKINITALKNKINGWKKTTKYLVAVSLFVFMSFGVLSVLAFSDWYFNHRTLQSTATQLDTQENKYDTLGKTNIKQEAITQNIQETISVKQPASNKSEEAISASNQDKLDKTNAEIKKLEAFKKQADEYNAQTKESLANLKKTISNQPITPPIVKPIVVPKIDTTIKTPTPPKTHYTTTCWDDTLLGKQCKTTMSVY